MKHFIYLAGPMTGITVHSANDWRDEISDKLNSQFIQCLSPLRGGSFSNAQHIITHAEFDPMTTAKGLTRRDMTDLHKSDCVIVNFLESTRVSIGTVMEIAWAYKAQIPLIVVTDPKDYAPYGQHSHPMVTEAATYTVKTLDEAVLLAKFVIGV